MTVWIVNLSLLVLFTCCCREAVFSFVGIWTDSGHAVKRISLCVFAIATLTKHTLTVAQ